MHDERSLRSGPLEARRTGSYIAPVFTGECAAKFSGLELSRLARRVWERSVGPPPARTPRWGRHEGHVTAAAGSYTITDNTRRYPMWR